MIVTNDPFFAESVIIVVRVFGANKALGVTRYAAPSSSLPRPLFVTTLGPHVMRRQARDPEPGYCDTSETEPGSSVSLDTRLPRHLESGVHPTSRPARPSCSLLGVKTKTHPRSSSNLAWDRVGIDIDPSQTNERPQISECGAA